MVPHEIVCKLQSNGDSNEDVERKNEAGQWA